MSLRLSYRYSRVEYSETLRSLGYYVGEITLDPVQRVGVAFASRPQEAMLEVISDLDTDGPTHRIISKTGKGLYHICYEADNLEESMLRMGNKGFLLIDAPVPAVASDGKRIAWEYKRYIGSTRLIERSKGGDYV